MSTELAPLLFHLLVWYGWSVSTIWRTMNLVISWRSSVKPRDLETDGVATIFQTGTSVYRGTRWRSCLRHCAPNQKVVGSIPNDVIGIFHWHNPSGRTMALGLTQPLTEMSTRNISWGGKGGRYVGLTTLPLLCADCLEIWEPQPPGTLWACPGL